MLCLTRCCIYLKRFCLVLELKFWKYGHSVKKEAFHVDQLGNVNQGKYTWNWCQTYKPRVSHKTSSFPSFLPCLPCPVLPKTQTQLPEVFCWPLFNLKQPSHNYLLFIYQFKVKLNKTKVIHFPKDSFCGQVERPHVASSSLVVITLISKLVSFITLIQKLLSMTWKTKGSLSWWTFFTEWQLASWWAPLIVCCHNLLSMWYRECSHVEPVCRKKFSGTYMLKRTVQK